MVHSGALLFRWRSFVPLPCVALLFFAMTQPSAMLLHRGGGPDAWDWLCLGAAATGLLIRAHAIGHAPPLTSGGNLRQQAASTLNVTGMYSITRHPLYLGNLVLWSGVSLLSRSPWVLLVSALAFWLCYERIILTEEEFLERRFGAPFRRWAARTPALLPRPGTWQAPATPFSWRRIVRREYNGLLALIALFVALTYFRDWWFLGRTAASPASAVLLILAATAAVMCIAVKKCTTWLESTASAPPQTDTAAATS